MRVYSGYFHVLRGASGVKNKNRLPGPVDHFSSKRSRFWTLSMDTNWLDMLSGMVIFLFCGPPAKSLLRIGHRNDADTPYAIQP